MESTHRDIHDGFTLIELSIVLVIIGLIVGGVLVGQNLIQAAAVRAQVAQIEKYNTAVNAFREKYSALPGDIKDPNASQFGFQPRGVYRGQGDGNGLIEGTECDSGAFCYCLYCDLGGEQGTFWVDLSTAHLIDGGFTTANITVSPASSITGAAFNPYLPVAKLGSNYSIYVWTDDAYNYFGLATPVSADYPSNDFLVSSPTITVQTAFNIDKKIDDGLPTSGNVIAVYAHNGLFWISGAYLMLGPGSDKIDTTSITPSASTCYDNAGGTNATQTYSLTQNSGAGANCALSFRFE